MTIEYKVRLITLKKYALLIFIVLLFFINYQEVDGGLFAVCPSVCDLAWSPDQDMLAMVNEFGLWMYDADDPDASLELFPFENATSLDFSPDGQSIAITACLEISENERDCTSLISIFDLETKSWQEIARYEFEVTDVLFSPDGSILTVEQKKAGRRGLRLIDLTSGEEMTIVEPLRTNDILSSAFSPDGRYIAIINGSSIQQGGILNGVTVWEISTGNRIAESTSNIYVSEVIFLPDSSTLLYIHPDSTIVEWDYQNDVIISTQRYAEILWDSVNRFDLIEESPYFIASVSGENPLSRLLFVWAFDSGTEIFSTMILPYRHVELVAISPSGRFFAASSLFIDGNFVELWEIDTNSHQRLGLIPRE